MACNNLFIKGQFAYETYTFCGIVPIENENKYKSGIWQFWNANGDLIAKGPYKSKKIQIDGQGGCIYEITRGVIEKEEWEFWDDYGQEIEPNKEDFIKLEMCTREL